MKSKWYLFLGFGVIGIFLFFIQSPGLHSTEPAPMMQQHAIHTRPLNIITEETGRVWFTLPDANAIGSLVVSDTVTITTHLVPTEGSQPYDLIYVDDAVWFTDRSINQIGRFETQGGTFEEFPIPTANSDPRGIAVAPDGTLWFAQRASSRIGRFDPHTQHFIEYAYHTPQAEFEDIAVVDNHTVWVTVPNLDQIVRLQLHGESHSFYVQSTTPYTRPTGIVVAGGERLWVTASGSNALLRFTPDRLTPWQSYNLPTPDGDPTMLAFVDLGDIWEFWFTQHESGKVGQLRVQPNGKLVSMLEQDLPVGLGQPWGVTTDANGHVWVAAGEGNQIVQWQPPYFELPVELSNAFLPFIVRDRCSQIKAPTLFGFQMYGRTGITTPYHTFLIESGAHWVRNEIFWRGIEPVNTDPTQFAWHGTDAVASAAREGCFNMVMTIHGNPTWAANLSGGPINRTGIHEFAEFVSAVVERYDGDGFADAPGSPVVKFFEFYNEPDAGWSAWGHHGAAYAAMLTAVYPAVKAANPEAQVVFGGIAYDGFQEHGGPFVRSFLNDVLAAGGGAYFDYMNFHYYPAFAGNWTEGNGSGLLEKTKAVRDVLNAHDVDKPIIITELGWPNPDQSGAINANDIQSQYVVALHTQGLVAGLEMITWWTLVDIDPVVWNMGLITSGQPPVKKPAFSVYQRMVEELSHAAYDPSLPQPETGNDDLEFYSLHDRATGQTLYVAWLNPIHSTDTAELYIETAKVSVHHLHGELHTIEDGDDQESDGKVTVVVGAPVYIRILE